MKDAFSRVARLFQRPALSAILISVAADIPVHAADTQEENYELEEIVVTATRAPEAFSDITRNVFVITRRDIERTPVHSIAELLGYALGVDTKQRGPFGVQADVSIRGGTFEQTLILIDGVKVNDPQTGHHNLDLPLTLDDIESIEVLKGHGSRLYGPNAFGGVINLITRKEASKQLQIKTSAGEHGWVDGDLSLAYALGAVSNRVSVSRKQSDGYRENTEFDITTVSYNASAPVGSGAMTFSAGHTDREFGANSFYSDAFPNEWEHTKATFLNAGLNVKSGSVSFAPKVYWRRHKDDFILDRDRPDWYRNRHTTDIYGAEAQSAILSTWGLTTVGGEWGREKITSNSLGDHDRTRGGLFFEHQAAPTNQLTLILGAFAYHHTGWGWDFYPGFDAGFKLSNTFRLFGSIGRSFRVPTFTDLYYTSPANLGNPDLRPEEAWSYEAGLAWRKKAARGTASLFRRNGRNLIDWVRFDPADPWQVQNLIRVNTTGLEISVRLLPAKWRSTLPFSRIQAHYAFLTSDVKTGSFESKYALNHLRHQFILHVEHTLFHNLTQTWKFRFEDRDDRYALVDTRIGLRTHQVEWFVEATNLFNAEYKDIGSIPMPGRWIRAGLDVKIGDQN